MALEGLASSDWHFGGFHKHFKDAVPRQLFEIDKIYQYAVSNGVKNVFVAGDISDTPHMNVDTYIALVLFLKKYDGIIDTYYIAGNHDFSDIKKTSMDLLKVLVDNGFFETFKLFLSPDSLSIDDCPVNFLPYPCLESPESETPALNISHVTYTGAMGDNGRPLRAKEEFIQNPGDFNISGHIHQYQLLKSKRAVYCGNPYQKNFGESLPKGFIHFKANVRNDKIIFKHKFINNKPDFELINFHVDSREDFAKLSDSDSIRYKLWIGEGVEIPKDLRIRYPNITGGIFDKTSKTTADIPDSSIAPVTNANTRVNLTKGLGAFFKKQGFKKQQYLEACSIVDQARNELGL